MRTHPLENEIMGLESHDILVPFKILLKEKREHAFEVGLQIHGISW